MSLREEFYREECGKCTKNITLPNQTRLTCRFSGHSILCYTKWIEKRDEEREELLAKERQAKEELLECLKKRVESAERNKDYLKKELPLFSWEEVVQEEIELISKYSEKSGNAEEKVRQQTLCCVCHEVAVDVEHGYDTCDYCASRI